MAKLNIFDIVALAKAGYKAADIEKLTSGDIPEDGDDSNSEPASEPEQPTAENSAKEPEQVTSGTGDKVDDIDYKKLYEEKCAELETAQKTNVHQNQPKPENTTNLNDIIRAFM